MSMLAPAAACSGSCQQWITMAPTFSLVRVCSTPAPEQSGERWHSQFAICNENCRSVAKLQYLFQLKTLIAKVGE